MSERVEQVENFADLMSKIYEAFQSGKSFEFTQADAKALLEGSAALIKPQPKIALDEFPEVLDGDKKQAAVENQLLQEFLQPNQPKPLFTIIRAKSLDLLIDNVNKFSQQTPIRIITTSPIQVWNEEFTKEVIYFDLETIQN